MNISDTTRGESVRKSGGLIPFKISTRFEAATTKILNPIWVIPHFAQISITQKPSAGGYCGRVLFFDIGAPKTLQVEPPARTFRVTSCDRLPAKTIKPFEEGWIAPP